MTIVRNFFLDLKVYIGRIQLFNAMDWIVYILWIGMMVGLFAAVSGFLGIGALHDVQYPIWVWNIPIGVACFVIAIAIDTIGHRTVYKEELERGEGLIHQITIVSGMASVILLCLGYEHPQMVRIPALVFIALSIIYSLFDEALHWHRYLTQRSDRIEMWSHYFIMVGHLIMVLSWWKWFEEGYPGVKETLLWLPH